MQIQHRLPAILTAVGTSALVVSCSPASRMDLMCMAGEVDRCHQLADMYATGDGVGRDLARAASLYERVCEAGEADVCNTLGEIYERGAVIGVGATRVEELFARACDGGSLFGCVNLGVVAAESGNAERAVGLFERACAGGAAVGCHRLAAALEKGEGTTRNVPRAVALYDQACEAEHVDSCFALAALFTAGGSVEKDFALAARSLARAARIYGAGCDAGVASDCDARDRARTRMTVLQQQAGR